VSATLPSYCAHGQQPIVAPAVNEWTIRNLLHLLSGRTACPDVAGNWRDCVMVHRGKVIYATIVNYVQNELRYMDAGDEAQQRQQGQ
jgi:hypothetical protein